MLKSVIGIVLLLAAGGGAYVVGLPMIDEVQAATEEARVIDELITVRESLNAIGLDVIRRYEAVSQADLSRIDTLVPSQIDNVKLILELQKLAEQYGLTVERIDVSGEGSRDIGGRSLNSVSFQANIEGSYADFVEFLKQLEKNQRIIDLRSISFQSTSDEDALYLYNITLDTYWLEE